MQETVWSDIMKSELDLESELFPEGESGPICDIFFIRMSVFAGDKMDIHAFVKRLPANGQNNCERKSFSQRAAIKEILKVERRILTRNRRIQWFTNLLDWLTGNTDDKQLIEQEAIRSHLEKLDLTRDDLDQNDPLRVQKWRPCLLVFISPFGNLEFDQQTVTPKAVEPKKIDPSMSFPRVWNNGAENRLSIFTWYSTYDANETNANHRGTYHHNYHLSALIDNGTLPIIIDPSNSNEGTPPS